MNMQQTSGSSGRWSDNNYNHSIFPMNQIFLYVFILNWRNMIIYLIYFFKVSHPLLLHDGATQEELQY